MNHMHLLAHALSTPWALMPERMGAYAAILAGHYAGTLPPKAASAAEPQAAAKASTARAAGGSIAVIPVSGPIVEWGSQIGPCEDGTAARDIQRALVEAEQDETVGQVLMVFSTPGGSVYGIPETADTMARVKSKKPVVGVSQSLAASAGYWLLSQCTEAYCTPGGEVGSIGVYSAYENIERALEQAGVSVELFSAGKYKTEMSPFGPLSDEARSFQIQRANDYYAMFTKAVSKGRGKPIDAVRQGMGEGRCLGAQAALEAGMIDGVMSVDEVLAKMQRSAKGQARGSSSRSALMAAKRQLEIMG